MDNVPIKTFREPEHYDAKVHNHQQPIPKSHQLRTFSGHYISEDSPKTFPSAGHKYRVVKAVTSLPTLHKP